MEQLFNIKNFVRALVFAIVTFILYGLFGMLFKNEINWESNLIMSLIIFIINFIIGAKEVTWKQLFLGKKKIQN